MPPPRPTFSLSSRLLLVLLLPVFFVFFSLRRSPPSSQATPLPARRHPAAAAAASARRLFLSLSASANSSISSHLRSLTLRPHLAGTPSASSAATYVSSHLNLSGFQTLTLDYSPLLSYPAAASLSLLHPNGTLIKPIPLADPADPASRAVPPYHSYSPSGSAVAPAIYANLGRDEDYLALRRLRVDVQDRVVVVRRGGGTRGAVVEAAAERRAKAVLMFGSAAGGGVERGTVLIGGAGDPLTPGWAAGAAAERLRLEDSEVTRRFPKIPSMPLSAAAAAEILASLGGPMAPSEWMADATAVRGVGGGSTMVNFTYQEDRKLAVIKNIIGIIKGSEEPDRYVILGNHRDAWTYGAVDPNSGTAVLLDIASRYGALLHSGWRPKRTIILCSWDAEEFGMIGSTEWVEQNLGILSSNAVVYLNVDCAVQGPDFFVGATPQLDNLLIEVMKQVRDPDSEAMTVYQTWVAKNGGISIERLSRADSDFTAFLHYTGIPAVDLYFGEDFPFYHTTLDTYEWMVKHGDPSFHRHVATSEILGLLGLRLADDRILPFNYLSYANQLREHANALAALLGDSEAVEPIHSSIVDLAAAARKAQQELEEFAVEGIADDAASWLRLRAFNDRLMLAERAFLEAEGLRGRPWFKHMLYSPPKDAISKLSFFPGIADAISEAKSSIQEGHLKMEHEIWRVARAIQRAANVLRGELA